MTINILNLKTDTDIQGWDALAHRADKKNLLDKKMYWKKMYWSCDNRNRVKFSISHFRPGLTRTSARFLFSLSALS